MASAIDSPQSNFDLSELESLGLSSYEAKAYYNMLPLGEKTAKEISEVVRIPFGRIYDVLSSLKNKGLVKEVEDSRPKLYSANEPNIAIKSLLDRKSMEYSELKQRAVKIEEMLKHKHPSPSEDSPFWSVALDEETMIKHEQKLSQAEIDVCIYLNVGTHYSSNPSEAYTIQSLQVFNELVEKGVNLRIIFGGISFKDLAERFQTYFNPLIEKYPIFNELLQQIDIRFTETITNTFDVIDHEKVIIKIENPVSQNDYLSMIYLWQKSFADKMKGIFEGMWVSSRVLEELVPKS